MAGTSPPRTGHLSLQGRAVRPRQLPKVRDQVLRHLTDPSMPIRARTGDENRAGLDLTVNHLREAGLYWATADMTALAMSAGSSLAAARWATADRPSGCGLIVWDGGIGTIDAHGVEIPIEAVTWGPSPDGCMIGLWISRVRVQEELAATGQELVVEQVPPLMPILGFDVPVTAEPVPFVELGAKAPMSITAALAAAWLLMQQPNLVERTIERPDKSVRRAYGRAGREDPEVSVIDLRHQYVPKDPDAGEETGARRYRHRWVVSGHWRNQPYGPDREQRRRQWIPSYTKGPNGAPLLITEKVNVWRR